MIIGEWQGNDEPIEKRVYEMLPESDLLSRSYQNRKGETILLFIVASSTNPEAFHPPEICFEGAGAQFLTKDTPEISIGKEKFKINKVYIKRKGIEDLALYWFRVGRENTHNYYIHQLNMVFHQMMRKDSISAMIRTSAIVENGKIDKTYELEENFIKEIYPLLDKYLTR